MTMPAAEAALPAGAGMPRPQWIDVKGVRTCYYEAGKGEPLLLVHGGNFGAFECSVNSGGWSYNIEPLARHFRVIAVDRLGQGYTGAPLRDEDYTMAASVRHVIDFIEIMQLPAVNIIGHSRGAFVAVRVALERPELVRSVGIVTSATLMPNVSTNESALVPCPMPPLSREAARWVLENYSFRPAVVTEDWVEMSYASMSSPEYRIGVRKMFDEGLKARLFVPELARQKRETLNWINEGRLQRPVQMTWGANDRTASVDGGIALFEMIARHERRTEFHLLNEAGHFIYAEQPAQFNALVTRFIHGLSVEI
jgi:2-hydroxy-6-oxonona-2,4-dienedioate hydrolase